MIRGATSSIGMLAIQVAKRIGLKVLATTRKREKAAVLLEIGADHVLIDEGNVAHELRQLLPQGVNKVLELIGTSTLKDSLLCVSHGGVVCMSGRLSELKTIKIL